MTLNTYNIIALFICLTLGLSSYGQCLKAPEYRREQPPVWINEMLKKTLHFAKQDNFNIKIFGTNQGSAFTDAIYNKERLPIDIICINFNKYELICRANNIQNDEKKAIFYWILGHEFNHINKNHHYIEQSFLTKRLYQELQSDFCAGALLAAETDIGISFFQKLKFLFNESSKNNAIPTHPKSEYRILSAMGGWLQEKSNINNSDTILFDEKQFIKNIINYNNYKVIEEGNGKRFGIHIYPNKDIYYGFYNKKGQRHGHGVFEVHNGEKDAKYIYMGEWSKGNKEGEGVQVEEDNFYYETRFYKNNMNGQGVLIIPGESIYKGAFRNNKRHGQGQLESDNGNIIYSGSWIKGKQNGFGIEINKKDKTLKEGIWEKGEYQGQTHNYIKQ